MTNMRGRQEDVTGWEILDGVILQVMLHCRLQQKIKLDRDLQKDSEAAVGVREVS